jgi:hypothetical protein
MAQITLWTSETDRESLPDICIVCGQPAISFVKKSFAWHPPWIAVLVLVGLLPYILVAIALTKYMTVDAPVCGGHRGYWWKRQLLSWLPPPLLLIAGLGAVLAVGDAKPGEANMAGFVCVGTAGLFFTWLTFALVIQSKMVRPAEITERSITLKSVHREFAAAINEIRRSGGFDRDDDNENDCRDQLRRERWARERFGDDKAHEHFRSAHCADEPPDERIQSA